MKDIQELVDAVALRITAAEQEASSREAARVEPTGSGVPDKGVGVPPTRPPRKARKPARKRAKPTEVIPAEKLEAILAQHDGLSTGALSEAASADPVLVLPLLRELEAAGRIRRTGERRGTRWHAITDNDRIAARVAELEAQSAGKAKPITA